MRSFLKELALSLSFREAKGERGAAGGSLSAQMGDFRHVCSQWKPAPIKCLDPTRKRANKGAELQGSHVTH